MYEGYHWDPYWEDYVEDGPWYDEDWYCVHMGINYYWCDTTEAWLPDEEAEQEDHEVVSENTTPGTRERDQLRETDLVNESARHLIQQSLPVANDEERDAAARSVARAAEAAGNVANVATGPSACGFMSLGAAGPLGTAAFSANPNGVGAPGAGAHVSVSAARSAHGNHAHLATQVGDRRRAAHLSQRGEDGARLP